LPIREASDHQADTEQTPPTPKKIERVNQIHHLKQTRYQQTSDAAPISSKMVLLTNLVLVRYIPPTPNNNTRNIYGKYYRIVETQHTEQEEQLITQPADAGHAFHGHESPISPPLDGEGHGP
jgi:hypothetical protein